MALQRNVMVMPRQCHGNGMPMASRYSHGALAHPVIASPRALMLGLMEDVSAPSIPRTQIPRGTVQDSINICVHIDLYDRVSFILVFTFLYRCLVLLVCLSSQIVICSCVCGLLAFHFEPGDQTFICLHFGQRSIAWLKYCACH